MGSGVPLGTGLAPGPRYLDYLSSKREEVRMLRILTALTLLLSSAVAATAALTVRKVRGSGCSCEGWYDERYSSMASAVPWPAKWWAKT